MVRGLPPSSLIARRPLLSFSWALVPSLGGSRRTPAPPQKNRARGNGGRRRCVFGQPKPAGRPAERSKPTMNTRGRFCGMPKCIAFRTRHVTKYMRDAFRVRIMLSKTFLWPLWVKAATFSRRKLFGDFSSITFAIWAKKSCRAPAGPRGPLLCPLETMAGKGDPPCGGRRPACP